MAWRRRRDLEQRREREDDRTAGIEDHETTSGPCCGVADRAHRALRATHAHPALAPFAVLRDHCVRGQPQESAQQPIEPRQCLSEALEHRRLVDREMLIEPRGRGDQRLEIRRSALAARDRGMKQLDELGQRERLSLLAHRTGDLAREPDPLEVGEPVLAQRPQRVGDLGWIGAGPGRMAPAREREVAEHPYDHADHAEHRALRLVRVANAIERGHRLGERLRRVREHLLAQERIELRQLDRIDLERRGLTQRRAELERGRVAVGGLLRHRLRDHGIECGRELTAKRRHRLPRVQACDAHHRRAGERQPPGESLVREDAERVHIGARIGLARIDPLLRRHVGGGSEVTSRARVAQRCREIERRCPPVHGDDAGLVVAGGRSRLDGFPGRVLALRDAEVEQLR